MAKLDGNPAMPNVLMLSRARAGAAEPVPSRLYKPTTGNQRILTCIALVLGRLPLETIRPASMALDLGRVSALSITIRLSLQWLDAIGRTHPTGSKNSAGFGVGVAMVHGNAHVMLSLRYIPEYRR
jgi:hypothetical protein